MPVIYCIIPRKSPSLAHNDTRSGRLYAIIDNMTETYQTQGAARPDIASGKDAAYENFPVGSWLLPAHLRPHIAKYYHFARTIDDIADTDKLPAVEKCRQLDQFADVIRGHVTDDPALSPAVQMLRSLEETGITSQHCLDLIDAFKQDAVKTRYENWEDLIGYCLRSASPVGRYLLDLHGENKMHYQYSDALCNALQVINHLQDCKDDFQTLDRVYLPEPWFVEFGSRIKDLPDDRA
ncbi:MAG: squalene/phytoene synthase family protein [Proteobacteria bacterium]|nr:squalene/phytoene synthase family protein [Pseudomonadota bacterium]